VLHSDRIMRCPSPDAPFSTVALLLAVPHFIEFSRRRIWLVGILPTITDASNFGTYLYLFIGFNRARRQRISRDSSCLVEQVCRSRAGVELGYNTNLLTCWAESKLRLGHARATDSQPDAKIDQPWLLPPLLCCKCMFQVFQIFQRFIVSVSYGYCKCCKCFRGMLQTFI
jgi:hypothetical protein